MVRIWGRIEKDNRIVKDAIFEDESNFYEENFLDYVSSLCETLNIATPIILSKHLSHYINFSNAVFFPTDFPEEVNFDKFIIEEASNY